ncbi:hypothetical protein [Microbacterium sp. 77mftsu3.1]|uniref:hypothetical protein n=1 Tax=Microbacterium sp. 77mftsu3.1 TaxID=1761802 RepID=UPI0003778733|nr:hypothetical protein [Microbacterium sp. 77mftsu3.1]SDH38755.1 hypothetical protein SAMN04488590_3204 [Microbacterium sp. 77mftsu3.1]
MSGPAECTHEEHWYSRSFCEEPCGQQHYYCRNNDCGAMLGECANFDSVPFPAPAMCSACDEEYATTTCGVPSHDCALCAGCRDVLDGREYTGVGALFNADLQAVDPGYASREDWVIPDPHTIEHVRPVGQR